MDNSELTLLRSLPVRVVLLMSLAIVQSGGDVGGAERPLDPIAAKLQPDRTVVYKRTGDLELELHLFLPRDSSTAHRNGAFVIFHGGGWTTGNVRRVYPFAAYFRRQGLVSAAAQYRFIGQQQFPKRDSQSTVFDCVKDGRSAIRYLRQHADELGIDPERIVVAGCSAGGHIAIGTALFDQVNDPSDDRSISCKPNALVLYYSVVDTSSQGYGQAKIGDQWKTLSPLHQIEPEQPPTLLFHGTADTVTPYAGAVAFRQRMSAVGNRCELISHAAGIHGHIIFDLKLFAAAMNQTRTFLIDVGMIPGETNKSRNASSGTNPGMITN